MSVVSELGKEKASSMARANMTEKPSNRHVTKLPTPEPVNVADYLEPDTTVSKGEYSPSGCKYFLISSYFLLLGFC